MSRSGEFHVSVITVPGRGRGRGASERIKVAELSELALESCSKNTVRTYGSYMRLLAKGEPTVPGPDGKPDKGIGELFADEVRPSPLKVALKVEYARAEKSAEARADRRESVGRVVRETTGSGAAFNAVGAWRCMFAFASDEQNVADGFNPALKVKKPARQKGRRTAIKLGPAAT